MARELIDIDAARSIVLAHAAPLAPEPVALEEALGRTLAADVRADGAVPPFDSSAMDGFAIRAADGTGATPEAPVWLRVIGEARAGHPAGCEIGGGEAVAISTGAMVPAGADAVIPVERTRRRDGAVELLACVPAGAHVRRAGDDVAAGETVLKRGAALGAAELGVLASLGCAAPQCARRPRVSVLVTGDELVGPGEELRPGAVRDSNAHTIVALARTHGAQVAAVAHVRDERGQTTAAIESALESDVLVICGGMSVGAHDHVRPSLAECGAQQHFFGVALKPGKPTWFGTRGRTLVFGLPGNPVSAMVTFLLFAAPALRALSGAPPEPRRAEALLGADYPKRPGRAHAVRCRLRLTERGLEAIPTGPQGSHVLTSMLGAEALAIIPAASGPLQAGERVAIELLSPAL